MAGAQEGAGTKRYRDGKEVEVNASSSPFMPMFMGFREELDKHHDRRERIIKASRDVTALSKKIIFSLQRVRRLKQNIPANIDAEVQERLETIKKALTTITPDLQGINAWRYQRQVSGGIQEYIEAISFKHYLQHQSLVPKEEASRDMPDGILLTQDDYILGLFDLVGEVMRFAITTMATSGSLPSSTGGGSSAERTVLMDLRSLRTQFETLDTTSTAGTGLGKDIEKKMEVMKTCVEKVEACVYAMVVRGRERPKGWVGDIAEERPLQESYLRINAMGARDRNTS